MSILTIPCHKRWDTVLMLNIKKPQIPKLDNYFRNSTDAKKSFSYFKKDSK